MTPDERQLISGLFDRMRGFGSPQKDRDAETLINESVRSLPDAPYMLVQSVLVQEHALQQANERIQALEEQVRNLQAQDAGRSQASGGSFLGGLFGTGRPAEPPRSGSGVPQIGSRAVPTPPGDNRTPLTPQGGPQPAASPWQQAAPGGGGFMRTAMATAAGVAGGMLVAGAIGNMLGGSHAHASQAGQAGQAGATGASTDATGNNNATSSNEPRAEQASNTDQTQQQQDSGYSDASWDDGGDFGGGDFDI
jgi:hypothetical protein